MSGETGSLGGEPEGVDTYCCEGRYLRCRTASLTLLEPGLIWGAGVRESYTRHSAQVTATHLANYIDFQSVTFGELRVPKQGVLGG